MSFAHFTEPFSPVTGSPLGMHHRYDPHALGFIQIDHRVRETACQRAAGGWSKLKEALRLTPNFLDEPFDFVVETAAQLCCDSRVMLNCLGVFFPRVGVKKRTVSPPGDFTDVGGHFFARNALNLATLDFFNAPVNLGFPRGLNIRGTGMDIVGKAAH